MCQAFRDSNPQCGQAASDNRRQVEFREVATCMGMEGFLPKISHADHTSVTTVVNKVIGDFQNTDTGVNEHIILNIKLELTRGQDGLWKVSNAAVENKAQNKGARDGPETKPATAQKPTETHNDVETQSGANKATKRCVSGHGCGWVILGDGSNDPCCRKI